MADIISGIFNTISAVAGLFLIDIIFKDFNHLISVDDEQFNEHDPKEPENNIRINTKKNISKRL